MTEKDVYKNGVALLEEWEDVNYCEHNFKFKDEWLTDKEVVDLLNELHDEKQSLKFDNKELIRFIKSKGYTLKDYIEFIGQFQSVGVNKEDWE